MDGPQAISHYVQHVAVLIARQSDQALQAQLGIGLSQYRILQAVQANPSVQQKQIARLLGQTEASVSRQIKAMTSKGLISADANPDNRREHVTVILLKGERLVESGTQLIAQELGPLLQPLSGREQATLLELLKSLSERTMTTETIG
jgi:DNA-binding MarR family transcriptional regulator